MAHPTPFGARGTRFIDLHDMAKLVRRVGLQRMLAELSQHIRADFLRWPQFQKTARTAHHSRVGVIELMPTGDDALFSFKYVNGHPLNPAQSLPTVMAFGVLADVGTGYPLLLSELTLTTALRTAATSALAARCMARPNARSMAVIGNGAQSEFQIHAFADQLGIQEFRLFDVDPAATRKLVRNLSPLTRAGRIRLEEATSVAAAVRGADIVTTVTADKRNATILADAMVEPGMHINAVGGDCPGKTELQKEILDRARVVVEYEPQTRIEGELQQMPPDFAVAELWELLQGDGVGRASASEITVFDSVGFALEDFSALRYLHQLALAQGIGRDIALVPALQDPKDLFSLLQPQDRLLAVA